MKPATDYSKLNLQDKPRRVLQTLVTRSPDIVSRDELIDDIWSGNYLVGDRGLNQALWTIRSELGDNARQPSFIKTLPRQGYQWIGSPPPKPPRHRGFMAAAALAASVGCIALITMSTADNKERIFTLPAQCQITDKSDVQAYRVDRDVFVDIVDGCRLIATPDGDKTFGSPMVSDDGKQVAFTVTENQACKFVTVDLTEGKRSNFDSCTSIQ